MILRKTFLSICFFAATLTAQQNPFVYTSGSYLFHSSNGNSLIKEPSLPIISFPLPFIGNIRSDTTTNSPERKKAEYGNFWDDPLGTKIYFRCALSYGHGNYDPMDEADPQVKHEFTAVTIGIENRDFFGIAISSIYLRRNAKLNTESPSGLTYNEKIAARGFALKMNINFRYLGFDLGDLWLNNDANFWSESYPYSNLSKIIVGIRLGLINKIYISATKNEELLCEYASVMINYHPINPNNRIAVGWSPTRMKGYSAAVDLSILKRIIIQLKITHYPGINWTAWRMGFAVII